MSIVSVKFWLSVLLLTGFLSVQGYGQDSTAIGNKGIEGYKSWSKQRFALRAGLGYQKALYGELGVSRHSYFYNDHGFASAAYYLSAEAVPAIRTGTDFLFGFKAGYELNARTLALGIESKLLTDANSYKGVITPKVGFGLLGLINLFYGYNIPLNKEPFKGTGAHQFSVTGNFNRNLFQQIRMLKQG